MSETTVPDALEQFRRDMEASLRAIEQGNQATLRDQFAMAALQGLLASLEPGTMTAPTETYADFAYQYADAMLMQRAKESV